MQTLQERLNEVIGEIGSLPRFKTLVRNRSGKRRDVPIDRALDGEPLKFYTLDRISSSLGLIPVVFFWEGKAVDLGYEGFVKGGDIIDIEYYVSESIRRYRNVYGLTQVQLAENSGISVSHLNQIEARKKQPSTNIIDRVSSEISLDRKYLFEPQTEVNQLVHSVVVGGYAEAFDSISQRLDCLPEGQSQYGLIRIEELIRNVDKFKAKLGEYRDEN